MKTAIDLFVTWPHEFDYGFNAFLKIINRYNGRVNFEKSLDVFKIWKNIEGIESLTWHHAYDPSTKKYSLLEDFLQLSEDC